MCLDHCVRASTRLLIVVFCLTVGAVIAHAVDGAPTQAGTNNGPRPGTILNSKTYQQAEGLLPDEFLALYRNGSWEHEVVAAAPGTHFEDPDFIAAGRTNENRFRIGPLGEVIDVRTGKQPLFVYGPPFPKIDANDPRAGAEIVWNFFYQSYSLGDTRQFIDLDWIGMKGLERTVTNEVTQRFFDGQPPAYQPKRNPQDFLFQQRAFAMTPADLQGTVSLTHRYRAPNRHDQVWTYVPALRRVRPVSPANRSDGFLGSDLSQDDGSYFDGKPEEFEWKLVGRGDVLMLFDRTAVVGGRNTLEVLPHGGFTSTDSLRPRFAYQQNKLNGVPWAPLQSEFVLVKRPVWIVEGKPHDPYYLYGKIILRFDRDSWRGTYSSKYDWQGQILNSYLPGYGVFFPIGGEWRSDAACLFTLAQNWKLQRATAGHPNKEHPKSDSRISFPAELFAVDALLRAGK